MPPEISQTRRTQSLLLISKLLDCRDNVSPFTLIVDSLEQSGKPLVREYIRRAKTTKTKTIFISFETLRPPKHIDHFIRAYTFPPTQLQQHLQPVLSNPPTKTLLILDSLHPLLLCPSLNTSTYLSSLLSPYTSLVATYHSTLPLPPPAPYTPQPLTLLTFLATTILTTHSLSHVLAQKAARDRSLAAPVFGLSESEEGTVQGLGANDERGLVIECEMRRKSGRGVELWFFLPNSIPAPSSHGSVNKAAAATTHDKKSPASIVLLDDYPLYRRASDGAGMTGLDVEAGIGEVSFSLGLTEKQRRDREGVVLPYFDAQREEGGGEGGRILYDMGVEDDFDEEEDEI